MSLKKHFSIPSKSLTESSGDDIVSFNPSVSDDDNKSVSPVSSISKTKKKTITHEHVITHPRNSLLSWSTQELSQEIKDESDTIDNILIKYGYICDQVVKVAHEQKSKIFAKSCNDNGEFCYIEIDEDVLPGNHVIVSGDISFQIEKSSKVSALDCAGSDICSIAYECNGDVCIMKNENNGNVSEVTFKEDANRVAEVTSANGGKMILPVVTLSEIKIDNASVSRRITLVNDRIQKSEFEKLKHELNGFSDKFFSLANVYSNFNNMLIKTHQERLYEINVINQAKTRQGVNVKGLHDLTRKKNIMNYQLSRFTTIVKEIGQKLEHTYNKLSENYCYLMNEAVESLDSTINGKERNIFLTSTWSGVNGSYLDIIGDYYKVHKVDKLMNFKRYIKSLDNGVNNEDFVNKLKKYLK